MVVAFDRTSYNKSYEWTRQALSEFKSHLVLMVNKKFTAKDDQKFFLEGGDPGFSPARNKAVIAATMIKYEAMRKKKAEIFKEGLGERNEALGSWVTSMRGSNKPIDKYLGRKWMTHLRGKQIAAELQDRLDMFRRINPNIIV